ncbi:hypothetical protein ACE41R_11065 [Alteromonas macleodii]|uniref:hypothetical protein n=1 Tax=Alteromonas macleodii TaxID=28108 RepID=UPI0031407879
MGLFTHGNKNSPVLHWEAVKVENTGGHIHRAHRTKVPGGWLVTLSNNNGLDSSFIPDPNHEWDGSSL